MVLVKFYDSFFQDLANNDIDLGADSFELILCTSSYTFDDGHTDRSDITNEVVTGGGYTAGGTALTNESVTLDAANNRVLFDFDDVTFSSSTITARSAIIFKDGGGASSTDRLVCQIDFEGDESSSNTDFVIQLSSSPAALFAIQAGS